MIQQSIRVEPLATQIRVQFDTVNPPNASKTLLTVDVYYTHRRAARAVWPAIVRFRAETREICAFDSAARWKDSDVEIGR